MSESKKRSRDEQPAELAEQNAAKRQARTDAKLNSNVTVRRIESATSILSALSEGKGVRLFSAQKKTWGLEVAPAHASDDISYVHVITIN